MITDHRRENMANYIFLPFSIHWPKEIIWVLLCIHNADPISVYFLSTENGIRAFSKPEISWNSRLSPKEAWVDVTEGGNVESMTFLRFSKFFWFLRFSKDEDSDTLASGKVRGKVKMWPTHLFTCLMQKWSRICHFTSKFASLVNWLFWIKVV